MKTTCIKKELIKSVDSYADLRGHSLLLWSCGLLLNSVYTCFGLQEERTALIRAHELNQTSVIKLLLTLLTFKTTRSYVLP